MANILHIFGTTRNLQTLCSSSASTFTPIISSADVEDGLEVGVTGCTAAAVALLAAGLANTCLNNVVILG